MIRAFHAMVLIAALVQGGTPYQPEGASSIGVMTRQSAYIIKGQVERLHASNLKILPATDRTALVRVQQVLHAPGSMGDFTGQVITIELVEPGGLKAGERAVFFTNGWLYGESLAVKEVGHSAAENKEISDKVIGQAQRGIEDENVQTRIRLAAAVVMGKVATTRPLKKEGKIGPVSEHDPDWQVATIEVESMLKGGPSKRSVAVLYPNSKDVAWFRAPMFHGGQEGIWILQEQKLEERMPELGGTIYSALDPLDFQPKSELIRVRRLVAGQK